jgi:3-deoxy-D-manno-octulosonic-acid transferase
MVRTPERPLVWFHAPSVGEGLQARPVIEALRAAHPQVQVAYTFFSPSAESFAASVPAELVDYLPFDSVANADAMLDALQPTLLVFAKLDLWPLLVARCRARNVPVALISGTVAPRSGRLRRLPRLLLRDAYGALEVAGAIDEENAERLVRLGVPSSRVRITGDTRFDQVAQRAATVDREAPLLAALASSRPTLVAGSTWPADEDALLPAFAALLRQHHPGTDNERPRLVIAPHEPTAAHVSRIAHWAEGASLLHTPIDSATPQADVVIVDRIGVLGQLYALAELAFVGGGFHAAGLHSVIEPAAFGAPVLFGPGHDMSREAGLLLDEGGAFAVAGSVDLQQHLERLLADQELRRRAGAAARRVVETGCGATMRSLDLLTPLLQPQRVTIEDSEGNGEGTEG